MTFYDSKGKAVAYLDTDNTHIFLYNGKAAGYLNDDAVYSYGGKHLGWYEDGWIRDKNGKCVFFTENTTGSGPVRPVKNVRPVKSVKSIKPVKSVKQVKSIKSAKSLSWSSLSGESFFNQ